MICPVCTCTFPLSNLNTHMKIFHTRKVFSNFKCKSGCFRSFSDFHSFSKHLSRCTLQTIDAPTSSVNVDDAPTSSVNVDDAPTSSVNVETINEPDCQSNNANANPIQLVPEIPDAVVFLDSIRKFSDQFVAWLYSKPSLPRSHIQDIIEDVVDYVSKCCDELKPVLKDFNLSENNFNEISKSFDVVKNSMSHLSTEYKRHLYFAKCGHLVPPIAHKVGTTNESKRTKDGTVFEQKDHFVHSVPLRTVFKKILELPDAFSAVQQYISSLEANTETIDNFMQCSLWKSKKARYPTDVIVLPLFLFCDDCEYNNPLGSHSKSVGACYMALPFLPEECQSALENIVLALLYKTSYRKLFGDDNVFAPLIAELTFLENEGILVSTDEGVKRVFLVTGLLLGDNKGLNSLLGYAECFTANFYCRFCKSHKSIMDTQCVEDESTLRTMASHQADLATNNVTLTGLKFDSALHKLPSFHGTSNWCVDSFHDLAEGVCHYVLSHLLNHCIPTYFTLDILNNRINLFDFGPCETNRVPPISPSSLSSDKLKLSGSETLLFVKVLGLLIGDLVPRNDPYWLLYLKLRELLDIIQSKSVPVSQPAALRVVVEEFNEMYVKVTKDNLKAKMHNLLHYARALENSGPFPFMAVHRLEAKHRAITVPAHTTSSRVNPTFTFAMRHQLSLCHRFMSRESILPKVRYGPSELVCVSDLDHCDLFGPSLPQSFMNGSFLCVDWLLLKGTKYKPGMALMVNANEHGPIFGKLEYILVLEDITTFVFCYYLSLGFDEHIRAYPVSRSNKWSCIDPKMLYDAFPLFAHRNIEGEEHISLKYRL